jgi:hypothetical protein
MASRKLSEIAKTIRSKNAGVDKITFDVIFRDRATYDLVRDSGVLSRAAVCRIFGIDAAQITDHVAFEPARRSSSRSTAVCRAAAPATPTSSAASNTVRCSISTCRTAEPWWWKWSEPHRWPLIAPHFAIASSHSPRPAGDERSVVARSVATG